VSSVIPDSKTGSVATFDPTRLRFNLDQRELKRTTVLVHGNWASGKTHLVGDFLRAEQSEGPVAFLDIVGEEGTDSCADMGLGENGYTIDSIKVLHQLLDWFKGNGGLRAVGLDSLKALVELVMVHVLGKSRYESAKVDIEPGEWGDIHRAMRQMVLKFRTVAPWTMMVSTSDISVDMVTKEGILGGGIKGKGGFIGPDLPGKQANGCAAWFNLVGFLRAEVESKRVSRTLMVTPSNKILTRQRLPRPILEDIKIPEGKGGWLSIKNTLLDHMKPLEGKVEKPNVKQALKPKKGVV